MKKDQAVILFCDSSSGRYIPQRFAQEIDQDCLFNVTDHQLNQLLAGDTAENEFYWEVWDYVLNNAIVRKDGQSWQLHQDGDLWLLDWDNMTLEEMKNFSDNEFDYQEALSDYNSAW